MFQTKVVERIKTHILRSVTFFSPENRAVYEIKRKILYSRTGHRLIYGSCALHAGYLSLPVQSDYVIINTFSHQKWFHERSSMLRYTYIAFPRCYMKCTLHVRGCGLDTTASALR